MTVDFDALLDPDPLPELVEPDPEAVAEAVPDGGADDVPLGVPLASEAFAA
ncbi:hypothetical protein [Demetria terragena]|uniref:hypothetical protein n=1 Tax=Demetria terragena TaxID=63959 RepID=UPI00035FB72D|nr:hypothetical protein [Demetria terragena]